MSQTQISQMIFTLTVCETLWYFLFYFILSLFKENVGPDFLNWLHDSLKSCDLQLKKYWLEYELILWMLP